MDQFSDNLGNRDACQYEAQNIAQGVRRSRPHGCRKGEIKGEIKHRLIQSGVGFLTATPINTLDIL